MTAVAGGVTGGVDVAAGLPATTDETSGLNGSFAWNRLRDATFSTDGEKVNSALIGVDDEAVSAAAGVGSGPPGNMRGLRL